MAKVIYVVGNAKNVGKTTVVKHLIQTTNNICVASIGFDGEEFDNITGSPKPYIELKENDFVLTCEKFLNGSHFSIMEIIDENPLAGTILLARSLLPSRVIVAGATPKAIEIVSRRDDFETLIVDGALDRVVHAGFTEKARLIFVIGSDPQMGERELTRSIERVFQAVRLSLAPEDVRETFKDCEMVCGLKSDGSVVKMGDSLLNYSAHEKEEYEWIFVPGVLVEETARKFSSVKFCLANPFSFFGTLSKFDNIYTVKELILEKIYINLFDRPWLEEKVVRLIESYGYRPYDIMYIDSQEG
ncbi:hypothetical protein ACSFC1_00600 [Pseudothermotoga sp. U03pept]|uniref:hypothetical protein n=1 Tax=Pseudothermotoga sp. U03pept TaxID=3447012 RepID=UPI003F10B5AF